MYYFKIKDNHADKSITKEKFGRTDKLCSEQPSLFLAHFAPRSDSAQ